MLRNYHRLNNFIFPVKWLLAIYLKKIIGNLIYVATTTCSSELTRSQQFTMLASYLRHVHWYCKYEALVHSHIIISYAVQIYLLWSFSFSRFYRVFYSFYFISKYTAGCIPIFYSAIKKRETIILCTLIILVELMFNSFIWSPIFMIVSKRTISINIHDSYDMKMLNTW